MLKNFLNEEEERGNYNLIMVPGMKIKLNIKGVMAFTIHVVDLSLNIDP